MKKRLLVLAVLLVATPAWADTWVKGHYSKDGDWVPGYWKTEPNGTPDDNYGTPGNYNPHKPQPNLPLAPYPPNKDYGTNPSPPSNGNGSSNTITIPRLDAPVGSLNNKDCPERTSIYQPRCP